MPTRMDLVHLPLLSLVFISSGADLVRALTFVLVMGIYFIILLYVSQSHSQPLLKVSAAARPARLALPASARLRTW